MFVRGVGDSVLSLSLYKHYFMYNQRLCYSLQAWHDLSVDSKEVLHVSESSAMWDWESTVCHVTWSKIHKRIVDWISRVQGIFLLLSAMHFVWGRNVSGAVVTFYEPPSSVGPQVPNWKLFWAGREVTFSIHWVKLKNYVYQIQGSCWFKQYFKRILFVFNPWSLWLIKEHEKINLSWSCCMVKT